VIYPIGDFEKQLGESQTQHPRRIKDKHTWVLLKDLVIAAEYPPKTEGGRKDVSRSLVEVNSRITMALACLCFVIVGVPLGINQHRRESSVGIAISLAVAGAFYLFCIAGESLAKNPAYHAHYIVWIPVVACLAISAVFTAKNN
jgi:lipopolysaccharide export LptBFGC system permease protein LptF